MHLPATFLSSFHGNSTATRLIRSTKGAWNTKRVIGLTMACLQIVCLHLKVCWLLRWLHDITRSPICRCRRCQEYFLQKQSARLNHSNPCKIRSKNNFVLAFSNVIIIIPSASRDKFDMFDSELPAGQICFWINVRFQRRTHMPTGTCTSSFHRAGSFLPRTCVFVLLAEVAAAGSWPTFVLVFEKCWLSCRYFWFPNIH